MPGLPAKKHKPSQERFRTQFNTHAPPARRGHLSRTVGDAGSSGAGYTAAEAGADLQRYAADIHPLRPCYSALAQRLAYQLINNLNGSELVTAIGGTTPALNQQFTETTLAEVTQANTTYTEKIFEEKGLDGPF